MSTEAIENKKTNFRKIDRKEPQWFYNIRNNGWNDFNQLQPPDRVKHLWRFTDPDNFKVSDVHDLMSITPPLTDITETDIIKVKPDFSGYSYNRSDYMTFAIIDPELADSGVIFKDLLSAVRDYEDLIGNNLGKIVNSDFGKNEAMNLALWNTGLFLYIPDNIALKKPIRLQRHPAGPYTFHRLLVLVGKNSKATIIDDYSGGCRKENALINSVVEISADDDSHVKYVNIQRHSPNCKTYVTQRARIANNSKFDSVFAGLGSAVSKVNAGSILNGRGAESRLYGIIFGDNNQHFDYHTAHHHLSSESYSNIDFKVALKDKSNSAYTGLIRIEEDAQNCEAFQENRNLLLDKGPKTESIPELEILCDQVQCSHGTTVGQIDDDMLFYLKSRGFSHDEAVRTIITGFIEPTLKQLPDDLSELIQNTVQTKLKG